MAASISDRDVSTLCDIVENMNAPGLEHPRPYPHTSVETLLACGFIEPAEDARDYIPTKAGRDFLSLRGAGLGEA